MMTMTKCLRGASVHMMTMTKCPRGASVHMMTMTKCPRGATCLLSYWLYHSNAIFS
jgi:hypothetical protein